METLAGTPMAAWDNARKKIVIRKRGEEQLLPEKLKNSITFTSLIADFLARRIEEDGGPEKVPNLATVIADLEEGLVRRFQNIRKPTTHGESAEFYKLLGEWFLAESDLLTSATGAVVESLREVAKLEYP